jgi:hypothetical protein
LIRATFIVRMWREPGQDHPAGWRGTVEHVQAGDRRAVTGAEGLAALLSAWLQEETDGEAGQCRNPDA